MRTVKVVLSALVVFSVAAPAVHADGRGVTVHMTNHRIVKGTDGKEALDDGSRARPGDVLEYQAIYRNEGATLAKNLLATLPVPSNGLEYLPQTAIPQGVQVSLDGKTFANPPLTRTVTLPNGTRATREVPVNEYRFLRWRVAELRPGASLTVSARMRVISEQSEESGK